MESEIKVGPTLKALLRFTKAEGSVFTWTALRDALAPLYGFEMRFKDVVHVLLSAYAEALAEPRYELGDGLVRTTELVLAPIAGGSLASPLTPQSSMTVEAFYNAMIGEMLSAIRLTRVEWCLADVWPERVAAPAAAEPVRVGVHSSE